MTRQSTVSLAALALVALLVAAPLVATVAVDDVAAANQSAGSSSGSEYSLEELKQDGTHQDVDSVRMGDTTEMMYWLVYWPANDIFADPGGDGQAPKLPENHTLGRDTVYLRTWAFSDREETVHLVFWEKKTRTVERGNTTVVEPYAANINHVTRDVTVDRGRPTVPIDLPNHQNQKRVTMWIEDKEWARWTFRHKSLATTQSVNINSAGDYLASVISDFILWILAGCFAVAFLCKKALDRAGDGPDYGLGPWVIGLSIATGLGSLIFYESVASLVVNAHIVLSLYVIGIFAIVQLETNSGDVRKAQFIQPTFRYAESPSGDEALDLVDVNISTYKLAEAPNKGLGVITTGVLPFLARAWGKFAVLANADDLRTKINVPDEADTDIDEVYVVDPEADELVYYDKEGWTLELPPLDREHAGEYLCAAAGLLLGGASVYSGAASALPVAAIVGAGLLVWLAKPVGGLAAVDPAPVHIRTAFATMLGLASEVDDAKTLDETKEQLDKERITKRRKIDEEVEKHDRTLVEEMLDPDEEIPAPTAETDDGDDEIVKRGRENAEGARSEGGVPGDD